MEVKGRNLIDGLPKNITAVSYTHLSARPDGTTATRVALRRRTRASSPTVLPAVSHFRSQTLEDVYKRQRLRLIGSAFHVFSGPNDFDSKSFTAAVFEPLDGGEAFAVLSTHLYYDCLLYTSFSTCPFYNWQTR